MSIFYQSHGGLIGIPNLLSTWYVESAVDPLGTGASRSLKICLACWKAVSISTKLCFVMLLFFFSVYNSWLLVLAERS